VATANKLSLPEEGLASLEEVFQLLAAHPGFHVARIRQYPGLVRIASWLGLLVKQARLLSFGAEFGNALTLLRFRVEWEGASRVSMEFIWHASKINPDWWVFIHFLDEAGEIRFQVDYNLQGVAPGVSGLLYLRRPIDIPSGVPSGVYRVRLGVWSPKEAAHLPLTRFRGCKREVARWYRNAVILDPVEYLFGQARSL
jgi:hypothetical protein